MLVGGLLVAACDTPADSGEAISSPSVTTAPLESSPSASRVADPAEVEVVGAYLAFWEAVAEAADPPDPDHAALEATTADPQLEQLREIFVEDLEQGRFRRVVGTYHPEVRALLDAGAAAVVDDCVEVDPEDGTYDAETGERISEPGEPGYRELLEARLELIGGTWKVVNINVVEGDSECEPAAS